MNNKNFAEYKQQDLIEFVNEALGGVVLEERGMMPFIEELMVEMEEKIFNQLNIEKEQSYSLDSFSYIPSKSSFFKKCVFWKGSKIRIDNKINGQNILIIDDTISRGQSIKEACRIMQETYAPKSITVLTLLSKIY